MDKKIDVKRRQSLLDISVQQTGSLEDIFEIIENNDISISDELAAGTLITANILTNKPVADYFRINGIKPATAITKDELNLILDKLEGIDYWIVENDFVVS